MKFLSVGEMVIDFLPGEAEGVFLRKAGGAPANVAIAIARQGCDSAFCGMMGDDDFGRFLLDTLKENNVKVVNEKLTDKAVTTMAFVTLTEDGDRSFTFARKPGADMFLNKADLDHPYFDEAGLVHAGSCSLSAGDAAEATVYALEEAHRRGKVVSFDVNYRNLMWNDDRDAATQAVVAILPYVDILKISEEEVDMLGGEENLQAAMKQYDIAVIVLTLGSAGVRCYWQDQVIDLPGIRTTCVDATGAGDAFFGGFLSSLLRSEVDSPEKFTKEILVDAIRTGNISGCLCVQKKGAIESLPYIEDVERYKKEIYG